MSRRRKLSRAEYDACLIVERLARAVGRECEIIFTDDGVSIAPLSWSGDVSAPALAEALTLALEEDR